MFHCSVMVVVGFPPLLQRGLEVGRSALESPLGPKVPHHHTRGEHRTLSGEWNTMLHLHIVVR